MQDTTASFFCCPVCRSPLWREGGSLRCAKGHNYDLSRRGTVNLLRAQEGGRRHGDDRTMVLARRRFLEGGWYEPLRQSLIELLAPRAGESLRLLDAGCGECWYTAGIRTALAALGCAVTAAGVDISRDALLAASVRREGLELAVASLFALPVADQACDAVLNVFAPLAADEFARVLREGGCLLRAIPLEGHLWELKEAVYQQPYENTVPDLTLPGFRLCERRELRGLLHLGDAQTIADLFMMTPYYYKTSKADQAKAAQLQRLDVRYEFGVLLYERE